MAINNGHDFLFNAEGIKLYLDYKWTCSQSTLRMVVLFHVISALALSDLTIELSPVINVRTFASIIIFGVLGGLSALFTLL